MVPPWKTPRIYIYIYSVYIYIYVYILHIYIYGTPLENPSYIYI